MEHSGIPVHIDWPAENEFIAAEATHFAPFYRTTFPPLFELSQGSLLMLQVLRVSAYPLPGLASFVFCGHSLELYNLLRVYSHRYHQTVGYPPMVISSKSYFWRFPSPSIWKRRITSSVFGLFIECNFTISDLPFLAPRSQIFFLF